MNRCKCSKRIDFGNCTWCGHCGTLRMSGRLFTPESAVTVHPEVMRLEKELARTRRELAGAKRLCSNLSGLIRDAARRGHVSADVADVLNRQESPSGHER